MNPSTTKQSFSDLDKKRKGPKKKPLNRYDNCCACCGASIGWKALAARVKDMTFSALDKVQLKYVCRECDAALIVSVCVDFAVREAMFDE